MRSGFYGSKLELKITCYKNHNNDKMYLCLIECDHEERGPPEFA